MASIELDAEHLLATLQVRDGRRVVVIADVFAPERDEVVLVLPRHDQDRAVRRLGWQLAQLADQVRADARTDVHRGGVIVAAPGGPEN